MENLADYDEAVEATTGFWRSVLGKLIRWALYIPVGLVSVTLIESFALLFFGWFFHGDARWFLVVGILLGGLVVFGVPIVLLYFGAIVLANRVICPIPRVGSIIFGTLYTLLSILWVVGFVAAVINDAPGAWTIVGVSLTRAVFFVIAMVAVVVLYSEGSER